MGIFDFVVGKMSKLNKEKKPPFDVEAEVAGAEDGVIDARDGRYIDPDYLPKEIRKIRLQNGLCMVRKQSNPKEWDVFEDIDFEDFI